MNGLWPAHEQHMLNVIHAFNQFQTIETHFETEPLHLWYKCSYLNSSSMSCATLATWPWKSSTAFCAPLVLLGKAGRGGIYSATLAASSCAGLFGTYIDRMIDYYQRMDFGINGIRFHVIIIIIPVSKLQTAFITQTEWNFSRKTLPMNFMNFIDSAMVKFRDKPSGFGAGWPQNNLKQDLWWNSGLWNLSHVYQQALTSM